MVRPLSRRSFLTATAGAAAGALVLGACGGDDSGSAASSSASASDATGEIILGKFFSDDALTGTGPQRLPLALFNVDGTLLDEVPSSITLTASKDGTALGEPVVVPAHREGLLRPYFPMVLDAVGAGIYTLTGTIEGSAVETNLQLQATSPARQPGQAITPVATPTTADGLGIELLCTQRPGPCPLHATSLADAVAAGGPVAFLIATPQYCKTAICGPVLDVLVAAAPDFAGVTFVHSEVYPTDAAAQRGLADDLVEAVRAQGLTFEPVLFLLRPGGTIAERLDVVFDATELRAGLTRLTA